MKLRDLIVDYVTFRQSMGQKFTTSANVLRAFCKAAGGDDTEADQVVPDRVLSFLGHPTTCYWHHKYSALACFYRYATSRNYLVSSPLPTMVPKAPPRFVPYIYSENEVRRLLDATMSYRRAHILLEPNTFRAVLLLLYGAGLRISEALALTMLDVDLVARQLVIQQTKFYKSRIIPIGKDLNDGMIRYAKRRHKAGHSMVPNAPFFAGRTGDRLTIPTVQQAFRQLRLHAGIRREDGARYQPRLHDLRHAFAVNRLVAWYKAGADVQALLPKLSTYLGHISLSSTQLYLTMTPELLQEACRRFERYVNEEGGHE
jgi:integrase/recombinase XerD